jgi:hypothetical protein
MTEFTNIPTGKHFVILTQNSRYIPGDERSRTNPGHGYPGGTEYFIKYDAYTDEDKWTKEIAYLTKNQTAFKAFKVTPVIITTEVKVRFGE